MNRNCITPALVLRLLLVVTMLLSASGMAASAGELSFKTASTPPFGPGSQTADLSYNSSTGTFNWSYYNSGDNNEDSEVNIADLTPIGVRFKEVGPFASDLVQDLIDSDQNDEINGADIVQIARHFMVTCAGYKLQVASTASGPWTDVADCLFPTVINVPGKRSKFEYTMTASPGYYRVVPYDFANTLGIPSNVISI